MGCAECEEGTESGEGRKCGSGENTGTGMSGRTRRQNHCFLSLLRTETTRRTRWSWMCDQL
jgi:hypothetical protein